MRLSAFTSVLIFAMAAPCTPASEPAVLQALILSGHNNHDWRTTTPWLREILEQSGRFQVRLLEQPAGLGLRTLSGVDLLVLNYNGPRLGEGSERALESYLSSGGALAVVHGASWAFSGLEVLGDGHVRTGLIEPPWPAYERMIGGVWSDSEPETGHSRYGPFTLRMLDRDHAATRGLPESMITVDELFHDLRMSDGVHVLAVAHSDTAAGGTGDDEPVLWTLRYGKGRIFHTVLGHDLAAMCEPAFVSTFVRGCEWAASGEVRAVVELPLVPYPPYAALPPPRVRVVTGGHGYDTSFYSIFDGLDWQHRRSGEDAFGRDFRDAVDVLVLYDMVPQIGEPERAHLSDFLGSDKGLVVLHHALANYNSWPWWTDEVVGGAYWLEGGKGMPPSTYEHDLELVIRSAARHPITEGTPALHLWDEAYKGMWISPDVEVLMRTEHESSDGPVVWINPFSDSRVVVIQLGHDYRAHVHPGFRRLVRRAILWSAGRL